MALLDETQAETRSPAVVEGEAQQYPTLAPQRLKDRAAAIEAERQAQPQTPEGYTGPTEGQDISGQVTTPEITAGGEYVTPESTVSGQLKTLLEEGSPLMSLAEARSKEQANRLGLLSSSMAVGAGQKALYESAMPIATQDASTYAQFGLAQQSAESQLKQTGYEADVTSGLKAQEGLIQAGLQEQQGEIQEKLVKTQGEVDMLLQKDQQSFQKSLTEYQEGEAFKRLTTELGSLEKRSTAEIEANVKMNTDKLNMEWDIKNAEILTNSAIAMEKIDSENQQAFMDMNKDMMYGFNQAVAQIMQNPDMSPEVKADAYNLLKDSIMSQVDMAASIFGADVSWSLPEFGTSGGSDGGSSASFVNNAYDAVSDVGGAETWTDMGSSGTGWRGTEYPTTPTTTTPPPTTTTPPPTGGGTISTINDTTMKTALKDSTLSRASTSTQFTTRFKQLYPNATSQQINQALDWWNTNWF